MKRTQPKNPIVVNFAYWIFIGLLAYMPLHIFLSTWLGTSFGVLEATRVLKDLVMIMGFSLIMVASIKQAWFKQLLRDKLIWLIVGYGVLTLLLALVRPTDTDAEILGLVYNTRFLVFFLYAIMLSKSVDRLKFRKQALVAVLGSALVVLSFGVLQYTVIPNNALNHFGYERANGVLPAFFIDDKPDLERAMSTLRDPNSFGSYVIIVGSLALALLLKKPNQKRLALGFLALSILCLWFSFSRSAWIGFAAAGIILFLGLKTRLKTEQTKKLALIGVVGVIVMASGLSLSRDSYFVQNVVFHADESTVLEDPNELRVRFWKESVSSIADDPIGSGPGTAGLASIRNNVQGTELNENYYLQIASEVGVIGLGLFVAIFGVVGLRLVRLSRQDWLALALLGSFIGLAITNFLVHIWSNEAVAYTWWGLAGLVVASRAINLSSNQQRKKTR